MLRRLSLSLLLIGCRLPAATISFEGVPDSTFVSTQYTATTGATFINAIILQSGVSLNELEFPPYSGTNVVSDSSGPMFVSFSSPVSSISGFFNYAQSISVSGYNSANNLLGTAVSKYSSNDALYGDSGSSPNELLQLNSATGFSKIQILGNPAGGSFTLDDLTFTPLAVPEIDANTSVSALALLAAVLLIGRSRNSKASAD